MKKPVVCIIARIVWSPRLADNDLNLAPALALARDLGRLYLIVQSPDEQAHVSHRGNLVVIHVPRKREKNADYLHFIAAATRLGLRLRAEAGVDVFDATEAIAGGLAGAILKVATRRRLLLHLQGELLNLPADHLSRMRVRQIRFIVKLVSRFADRVRCVSRSIFANAAAAGIPEAKLVYIPPRCDVRRFDPSLARRRQEVREGHGVAGKQVVLFLGTLSVHKGLGFLLRAFAEVAAQHPEAVLLLVGSGPLEAELRALTARLGIAGKVVFCGRVPYAQVADYLSAADLFVLPSVDEGLPRAVMEAMSMQVPVVASRVGGIPEIITPGETGLLVEPGDAAGLAAAMARVLGDQQAARLMALRGRAVVVANYSFEEGMRRYRDALYEVASLACV